MHQPNPRCNPAGWLYVLTHDPVTGSSLSLLSASDGSLFHTVVVIPPPIDGVYESKTMYSYSISTEKRNIISVVTPDDMWSVPVSSQGVFGGAIRHTKPSAGESAAALSAGAPRLPVRGVVTFCNGCDGRISQNGKTLTVGELTYELPKAGGEGWSETAFLKAELESSDFTATAFDPLTRTFFYSNEGGSSALFHLSSSQSASSNVWSAEDGLADVRSLVFLDPPSALGDDAAPTLSDRLRLQWENVSSRLTALKTLTSLSGMSPNEALHALGLGSSSGASDFGFDKVVVMLSGSGRLVSLRLNPRDQAPGVKFQVLTSHRVKAPKAGDLSLLLRSSAHEALFAVSSGKSLELQYLRPLGFAGPGKALTSLPPVALSSPTVNLMPSPASAAHHRQAVLAQLADGSVVGAPSEANAALAEYLAGASSSSSSSSSKTSKSSSSKSSSSSNTPDAADAEPKPVSPPNGFYSHVVDRASGTLKTYRVLSSAAAGLGPSVFSTVEVGRALFPPTEEVIVSVTYPPTVPAPVKSPAHVMGDDALLLKYLNPHVAVVVTSSTNPSSASASSSSSTPPVQVQPFSLGGGLSPGSQGSNAPIRKPLGVHAAIDADPGGSSSSSSQSSSSAVLYVNLVDTVSGRVLHRVGHPDGVVGAAGVVPVVISENWVVYTFWNSRTSRSEIGVLSLWEGMLDKNAITMFKTPQQEETFSSFTSPPPIVLQKTFVYQKTITGIGVTRTREGVSNKSFLLALGFNGQVVAVDRRLVDPRRPVAEPKLSEKMEGLSKYEPVIPFVPQTTVSYDRRVEGVRRVETAATMLESQSMLIAFGGADLFVTRVSPSRSFDKLPSTFSRAVLILGVLGIWGLLMVAKSYSRKKRISLAWA